MRDLLTGIALLLLLVLSAALVGPSFFNWTGYRAAIEERLTATLGAPVTVEGPISVRLLPTPYVTTGPVRVAGGQAGAGEPAPFEAEGVTVEMALTPLLRGDVHFNQATFLWPVIRPDGLGALGARLRERTGPAVGAVAIARLALRGARVLLPALDGRGGERLVASGSVDLEAVTLAGPWRGSGRVEVGGRGFDTRFSAGRLDESGRVPVRASLEDRGLSFTSEADGVLVLREAGRAVPIRYEGRLTASGHMRWPFAEGAGDAPWRVVGRGRTEGGGFRAEALDLEVGPQENLVRASGGALLDPSSSPPLTATLRLPTLDLDRLTATSDDRPTRQLSDVAEGFAGAIAALPFPAALTLDTDRVIGRGEVFGPASAVFTLSVGGVAIQRFETGFPGRGQASLSGTISAEPSARFTGRATIQAGDVPRAWSWLTGAPPQPGLVQRFSAAKSVQLTTELDLTPSTLAARGLSLALDGSTITGDARYEPAVGLRRPLLAARLEADRFDLDLLPDLTSAGTDRRTDLDLAFRAAAVTAPALGGRSIGGLDVALTAREGAVSLDRLVLAGGEEVSLQASGRLTERDGQIEATLDARRLDPLVEMLRRLAPGEATEGLALRAAQLAPARIMARVSRLPDGPLVTLDTEGSAAGTEFEGRAVARLDEDGQASALDQLSLRLGAPQAATLLRQIGLQPRSEDGGPVELRIEAFPGPNAVSPAAGWTIQGVISGVSLDASGALSGAGLLPGTRGALRLRSDDAGPLARLIGMPGTGDAPIPLDLRSDIDIGIGGVRFDRLEGSLAGVPATGTLFLGPFGEPRLTGQVGVRELSVAGLARFMLDADVVPPPGTFWSAAPFQAFRAPAVPLDVELRAPRFEIGQGFALTGAALSLRSQLDGWRMPSVTGDVAGGRVSAAVQLRREGAIAALNGRIELVNADLARLRADGLRGSVDVVLDLSASGASIERAVAALGGGGIFRLRGGRIEGLDPAGLRRAAVAVTEEVPTPALLAQRIEAELAKGPLVLGVDQATLTLSAGVLRAGPLRFALGEANATGQVALDLKTFTLDARGSLVDQGRRARPGVPALPLEMSVAFAGPISAPKRSVDVTALHSALTTQIVMRRLEEGDALRAQILEREAQDNRQRAERARLDAEQRAAEDARRRAALAEPEQRAAEEARRRAESEQRAAEETRRRAEAEEVRRRADIEQRAAEQRALDRRAAEQRAEDFRRRLEAERRRQVEESRRREDIAPSPPVRPSAGRQATEPLDITPR